jgi:hypothetical protein
MKRAFGKLTLMMTTLVLLVALTLGAVAPSVAARVVDTQVGVMEVQDGLHGLLANPFGGGGSDGG